MLKDVDTRLPLFDQIEKRFGRFYKKIFLYATTFDTSDGGLDVIIVSRTKLNRMKDITDPVDILIMFLIKQQLFLFGDKYYSVKEFSSLLNLLSFL